MTERALTIDAAASRLVVRTRATGMLARLAHDLEIVSASISGKARVGASAWSADLFVPASSLHVAGTLKGDRLDASALSASDRADIERRMRADALGGAPEIVVSLEGSARDAGEASLAIGRGPRARVRLVDLEARDHADGSVKVTGRAELSLRALGVAEIRAPLGAFKVSDKVEIIAELTLKPSD